jgi:hypothetical protein
VLISPGLIAMPALLGFGAGFGATIWVEYLRR